MSLHVSSAPHVHSKDSTQTIMRDVLIAMLPTTVMGVYCFGFNAWRPRYWPSTATRSSPVRGYA